MPNDAKLGLVVGVGLLMAVAVLFFRRDAPAGPPGAARLTPAIAPATPLPRPEGGPAGAALPVAARTP